VNGSGIRSSCVRALFLNELALRLTSGSVARVSQIADFNDLATKSKDALDTTPEASKRVRGPLLCMRSTPLTPLTSLLLMGECVLRRAELKQPAGELQRCRRS
jgi:hypothetical protein